MRRDRLRFLRNIGIAAHIDAGKTTLTERILYFTGKSHKIGETHDGDSQMDTTKQEIAKGITISSAATYTEWTRHQETYLLNIIDTPGHVDFMIEVERSLRVLDGMVALFDAVAGVESQTETIWQQAARYEIPVVAMVNKMDRVGADFQEVVRQIRERLNVNALPIHLPIGEEATFEGLIDLVEEKAIYWDKEGVLRVEETIPVDMKDLVKEHRENLLEVAVLFDEALMEQYFEAPESLQPEQIRRVLRQAVLKRQFVPVTLGAAYKNKGVHTLMDAICDYLPAPNDGKDLEGLDPETGETLLRKMNEAAPFAALVFKILLDDQNRQLSFFRVYAGRLKTGDVVWNPRTKKRERIARLYQMHANKRQEIKVASAGDIAATLGLKSVRTGDTLCTKETPVVLESLFVPPPVISMAIEAKRNEDLEALGQALAKLQLEDPSFKVRTDEASAQTVLFGMGELHLEIILEKLRDDFRLEVLVGAPKVAYQEVFTRSKKYRHRLKKQSGGPGMFAEMEVVIGPADEAYLESEAFVSEGKRLQFVSRIVGASIPKELIPAIELGFARMLESGVLAGFPIHSLKVELLDGKTHVKDSSAKAFEVCAMELFKEVAVQLSPEILEPFAAVEVRTPDEYLGNILGGLNRRRAIIMAQEISQQQIRLEAEVPIAEMFGYINHLRTVSAGRAVYSMKFKRYALMPGQLAELLVE